MNQKMVEELCAIVSKFGSNSEIRALIFRGAGGHFCCGGDIQEMQAIAPGASDFRQKIYASNRAFGSMLELVNCSPKLVICILEGAVLGGGFGLACVSDFALASVSAKFGMPETKLGLIPAQIAPFVVSRIGLTQARRLALLALEFDGQEAYRLGLVHDTFDQPEELAAKLALCIARVQNCGPQATAKTKEILLGASPQLMANLDHAAELFSGAIASAEGHEGLLAFREKRKPTWTNERSL